ncbi:putative toxin-antitoxin system toxin component, PIN family [Mitsuaria sp. 7]|uniref:putative toxin-antitoxin system toxin component, PIN family n=1 Tax=Mitsuaria sp. 7 TaxID=1658665 RepID=UPI0018D34AC7|nr:putative toxin-antitoxin system toxin component, PIN family [Mitsuaria sp. 7]
MDTNVLVSAFLWGRNPARIIEAVAEGEVQLFTSKALLDELAATLAKKKLAKAVSATGFSSEELVARYRQFSTLITARRLAFTACRDVDDDKVLACAITARAVLIVSGDDDLLSMKDFDDIPIMTVAQALKTLPDR